jgi:hypothetical protein
MNCAVPPAKRFEILANLRNYLGKIYLQFSIVAESFFRVVFQSRFEALLEFRSLMSVGLAMG